MAQYVTDEEVKEIERHEREEEIHEWIEEHEGAIMALIEDLKEMERTSYTIPQFDGVRWIA